MIYTVLGGKMRTIHTATGRGSVSNFNKLDISASVFITLVLSLFGFTAIAQSIAGIDIRLNTENEFYVAEYQQGDAPQLGVAVSRDSYVYVFSIDSDLRYAKVLPNSYEPNNYVYASQGASYPNFESQYSFSLEGLQDYTTLFALASPRAISDTRLERLIQKYVLFAEAYSDPAKLANVIIGPDIGSDISYLYVSGEQVSQSTSNVVPINPAYYQLDYALNTGMDIEVNSSIVQQESGTEYNLANYGAEYATGAYATAEYNEVLDAYQTSLDIYNTYTTDEAIATETSANLNSAQSNVVTASVVNQVKVFPQTITLTGVEPAPSEATAQVGYVAPVIEQQNTIVNDNTVLAVSNVAVSNVVTSPTEASIEQPISVVEQSLQSAVNTTPFRSWVALGLDSYRFEFQQYCYCTDEYLYEMIVSVENGNITQVQYLENNQDVPRHVFESVPTIEEMFMGIAEIRVEGLTTVNVSYDQNYSYPNNIYFVNNPKTDIDDVSYQISYFEIQ